MSSESSYANPSALVSTDWVLEHLHDPDVRLLEVDVDTSAYARGHIPGAVGINWTTQLGDPIRRDIPSRAAFEYLMGQAGVSNHTHMILYGDNNNWFAAFAYWIARMYGHTHMALMNGGRKKWELEGPTAGCGSSEKPDHHVQRQRTGPGAARIPERYARGRRGLARRVPRWSM